MDKVYGIYNIKAKCFQFGIKEPSKKRARNKLFKKIGKDAMKMRFVVREIKENTQLKMQEKRNYRKVYSKYVCIRFIVICAKI